MALVLASIASLGTACAREWKPETDARVDGVRDAATRDDRDREWAELRKHLYALKEGEPSVRRRAARALGEAGDSRAVPGLLEALSDEDLYTRVWAVEALGILDDARTSPALVRTLDSPDPRLRESASRALGGKKDDRSLLALMSALGDAGESVRVAASEALGKRKDPRAVNALLRAYRDGMARAQIVRALGEIGDKGVTATILKAAADRDPYIRIEAQEALTRRTGMDFGRDPKAWKAWWDGRKK